MSDQHLKQAEKWRVLVRYAKDVEYVDSQMVKSHTNAVASAVYDKLKELIKEDGG